LDEKKHKDELVTEIEFDPSVEKAPTKLQTIKGKTGAFVKKEAKAGVELAKSQLQKRKERKEKARIKELEEIKHPLVKDLERQRNRVTTLKTQIAETEDTDKEERLFNELLDLWDDLVNFYTPSPCLYPYLSFLPYKSPSCL